MVLRCVRCVVVGVLRGGSGSRAGAVCMLRKVQQRQQACAPASGRCACACPSPASLPPAPLLPTRAPHPFTPQGHCIITAGPTPFQHTPTHPP
jgi:hypothetical protein